MDDRKKASIFLGVDINNSHSSAAFFTAIEGKYRLIGREVAQTSKGEHLAGGVGKALRALQKSVSHKILNPNGGLIAPPVRMDEGIDHMGLVASDLDWVSCALFGCMAQGSLAAGKAVLNSLPIKIEEQHGLADLSNQLSIIEDLAVTKPDIILITGGEEEGAFDQIREWIETVRLSLLLMTPSMRPRVIFAGNSALSDYVSRHLEPVCSVFKRPNLFPSYGKINQGPTQLLLDQLIFQTWEKRLPGLSDLGKLSNGLKTTSAFANDRIIRYLGEPKDSLSSLDMSRGVLSINLHDVHSMISARHGDNSGTVIQKTWPDLSSPDISDISDYVFRWASANVTSTEAEQFVYNCALHPMMIPETVSELALSQGLTRYRIKKMMEKFSTNHSWFDYSPKFGLKHHFEPIIVSGDVFSDAPQTGQIMLMILDSLQPCGITTIVLDQHQILPLLGAIGTIEEILPVQVLASDAFINLGTVIVPTSGMEEGKQAMTIHVSTDAGKSYDVDIHQGTLRRLVIPSGATAILEIEPDQKTDVGFGGFGRGGQLKVTGGLSGVIVDARRRPFDLPDNDEDRVALLRQWHGVVGG